MKLTPRNAAAFFRKPDPDSVGVLIYGADPSRVALSRAEVIAAMIGARGEEEMRLTRVAAAELRNKAAPLVDAIKAVGFFPGPRAVLVEEATDQAAPAIADALQDWSKGDAQIVITAGALRAGSKLRKLFEGHKRAYAAALYDDPPGPEAVDRLLHAAGLTEIAPDALASLVALAGAMGPGDLGQLVNKLALYKLGDEGSLSVADVEACAPLSTEARVDAVLDVVADAQVGEIAPLMRRLQAQGVTAVSLCIGAARHFRTLHAVASDPGGPGAGIGRVRPPVHGPRRDRLLRQAQGWGTFKLEQALVLITDTDLALRSAGQTAPAMARAERMLIRLAMLGQRH